MRVVVCLLELSGTMVDSPECRKLVMMLRGYVKKALGLPPKAPPAVEQCLRMASRRLLRHCSATDIAALEVSGRPLFWMTDDVLVSFFEMKS